MTRREPCTKCGHELDVSTLEISVNDFDDFGPDSVIECEVCGHWMRVTGGLFLDELTR